MVFITFLWYQIRKYGSILTILDAFFSLLMTPPTLETSSCDSIASATWVGGAGCSLHACSMMHVRMGIYNLWMNPVTCNQNVNYGSVLCGSRAQASIRLSYGLSCVDECLVVYCSARIIGSGWVVPNTTGRISLAGQPLHKREEGSGVMPIRELYLLQPGVQPNQITLRHEGAGPPDYGSIN